MTNVLLDGPITNFQSKNILQLAMQHAARGLSDMVERPITIDVLKVETLSLSQIIGHAGSPETEIVGVYLLIEGDFTGQVILMLPLHEAFYLVDLLLCLTPGTTTSLGDLERSALAEVGNLTVSYFLNEIANRTTVSSRPSPPAVMVDMLGAIMNVIAAPMATVSDATLVVETIFQESGRTVLGYFWVLPYPTVADSGE
ncbi:MAG: hypothetical protein HC875_06340 [Anaerolineales bacterium]|nr:hypothetical protein [Anaerolineales bacterium]